MSKLKDLTGLRFGKLLVFCRSSNDELGKATWECICDCGNKKIIRSSNLVRNLSHSCGCNRVESCIQLHTKHSDNRSKEHKTWCAIKSRCRELDTPNCKNYGLRGIKIHPLWDDSYEAFLRDVGRAPSPNHSIERIDVNGNYEPGNVKWATSLEQGANKRNNVVFEYAGKRFIITELARCYKINIGTLRRRLIDYKWPVEVAIEKPVRKFKCKINA